jgi:two-component system, cell cycle response regulator
MNTHVPSQDAGSVALIAAAGSALAGRLTQEITKLGIKTNFVPLATVAEGELAATVLVFEHGPAIEGLRAALDSVGEPTLTIASPPQPAAKLRPLIETPLQLALESRPATIAPRPRRPSDEAPPGAPAGWHAFDPLTGVFNRRAFETQLWEALSPTAPNEARGLLRLNLDGFKAVNDKAGRELGDRILRAVAELLVRRLGPDDLVGRLGGDEFGCLLQRYDIDTIVRDSEQLLVEIAELVLPEMRSSPWRGRLSASGGLTVAEPGDRPEGLMREAEMALFEAKSRGRKRVETYDKLAASAKRSGRDLRLQFVESVTRVSVERLVELILPNIRPLVEELLDQLYTCSSTGLRNRRYFNEYLPVEVERARSEGTTLSLVMIDLDHFRDINTSYGWPTGDRVLQAFGDVARATVRSTDWIARWGGEEFVVVMPDTGLEAARQVAERVRQAFASAVIEGAEGQHVSATLSAGVAQLPDGAEAPVALMELVSNALLRAKERGRNRIEPHD